MGYNKRVDTNQPKIVKKFRNRKGTSVAHTHMQGHGFPDLCVGVEGISVVGDPEAILKKLEGLEGIVTIGGVNLLVEIKDGSLTPSQKKLTEPEEKWHREWKGQVCIIENEQEVEDLLKPLDKDISL